MRAAVSRARAVARVQPLAPLVRVVARVQPLAPPVRMVARVQPLAPPVRVVARVQPLAPPVSVVAPALAARVERLLPRRAAARCIRRSPPRSNCRPSRSQQTAQSGPAIASVRTGSISPNRPSGDTDNHTSTSVAFADGKVYAGVGSSCNACVESDPTRASIQQMDADGGNMATRATRFRNAIALTTNPVTGTLWAGGAGQDGLTGSHPYEFFDAVGLHAGVPDYGWPDCEENHIAYTSGADCSGTVAPLVELPPYSTIIGAAFYPTTASSNAFPASYRGGLFLAAHGSWHMSGTAFAAAPLVVFVPMNGDAPQTAVDWTDPTKQWTQFIGGFQLADGKTRVARPTGLAVGALGSLFIADDQNGYVYRVRPM